MNIAIDVRRIEDFGVGTYIRNLVRTLAARDLKNRYVLLGDPEKIAQVAALPKNFHVLSWPESRESWLQGVQLDRLLQGYSIHLLHFPNLRPALLVPYPYLMTVHDVADFIYARQSGWRHTVRWRLVRRTLSRARRIMAVSRATQRDLENLFGIPAGKIVVVENAIDERFIHLARREEQQLVLERYQVVDPFLLYVGSARPQKNLPRLIEAFAVLKGELRDHRKFANLKLLIIGDELSEHPELRRSVIRTRMEEHVRFLGYVPVAILRVFYQTAEVFVFPSLHEGFGLPPLEAMAQGTPVVTSSVSSLPE
ncbi:MAG TPA: glycosyltransferase family 1 protein, partial [Terriglobia bacterium]|nr:glycosyltransferase family 1 protein [Terriglobia bacterium]